MHTSRCNSQGQQHALLKQHIPPDCSDLAQLATKQPINQAIITPKRGPPLPSHAHLTCGIANADLIHTSGSQAARNSGSQALEHDDDFVENNSNHPAYPRNPGNSLLKILLNQEPENKGLQNSVQRLNIESEAATPMVKNNCQFARSAKINGLAKQQPKNPKQQCLWPRSRSVNTFAKTESSAKAMLAQHCWLHKTVPVENSHCSRHQPCSRQKHSDDTCTLESGQHTLPSQCAPSSVNGSPSRQGFLTTRGQLLANFSKTRKLQKTKYFLYTPCSAWSQCSPCSETNVTGAPP